MQVETDPNSNPFDYILSIFNANRQWKFRGLKLVLFETYSENSQNVHKDGASNVLRSPKHSRISLECVSNETPKMVRI